MFPTQNTANSAVDRDLRLTNPYDNNQTNGHDLHPPRPPRAIDSMITSVPPRPSRNIDLEFSDGQTRVPTSTNMFTDAPALASHYTAANHGVALSTPVPAYTYDRVNAPSQNNGAGQFPEWNMQPFAH